MGEGLDAGVPALLIDGVGIAAAADITVRHDNFRWESGGGRIIETSGSG